MAAGHRAAAGEVGQVRAGQVGRATEQLGDARRELGQHLLRGLARGDVLGGLAKADQHLGDRLGEILRQRPAQHAALELGRELRMLGAVGVEALLPAAVGGLAVFARVPGQPHRVGDLERRMRPADRRAGQRDLGRAERLAVGLGGVGAVGRALADAGLADDQRRALRTDPGAGQRGVDQRHVVAVDRADHVPAAGAETRGGVVGEPALHGAIDRDAVVVVERDQLVQLPHAGQRDRLLADALHQAAIAVEDVGVVVDDGVAGAVELARQQLLGQREADRVRQALAERAGGGLDAGRVADFRVARGAAAELPERLQVVDREVVAGQVQQRVEQHRGMAVREHEAVTVGPVRITRVVAQVARPERHRHLGHAHRGAGVAGVGALDGVHREGAQSIGHVGRGGGGRHGEAWWGAWVPACAGMAGGGARWRVRSRGGRACGGPSFAR